MKEMEEKKTLYWEEAYQAKTYLERWDYKQPSQELVALIAAELIPVGGKCLDVGCGAGNEAIFMAQCGFEVSGLDFSKKALEIAAENAKTANVNVEWINADVLNTTLAANSFDFINDRGCFHHIMTLEKRKEYAAEMARLLKPGGRLLIRGCRRNDMPSFILTNKEEIDSAFEKKFFRRGAVLPLALISNTGKLDCNVVVLTRV